MKSFGSEQKGKFIIQKIDTLPKWSIYDEGRLVYVRDVDKYYIGGLIDWVLLLAGNKVVNALMLDFGKGIRQVNAQAIPVRDLTNIFTDSTSIEHVLINLATGLDLQDECIISRHLSKAIIDITNIKIGNDADQLGSHSIPYKYQNQEVSTTVSDVLNHILSTYPISENKIIETTHWDFDLTNNMFFAVFFYENIRIPYPIVQFYDENGYMFIPNKVIIDIAAKQFKVWVPYKMKINISIMG